MWCRFWKISYDWLNRGEFTGREPIAVITLNLKVSLRRPPNPSENPLAGPFQITWQIPPKGLPWVLGGYPGIWSHRRVYSGGSYLLLNSIYVCYVSSSVRQIGSWLGEISFLQPFDRRNSTSVVLGAPKSAALVPPKSLLWWFLCNA